MITIRKGFEIGDKVEITYKSMFGSKEKKKVVGYVAVLHFDEHDDMDYVTISMNQSRPWWYLGWAFYTHKIINIKKVGGNK